MTPRTTAVLALLVPAAIASWYLSRSGEQDDSARPVTEPAHRGYYLKNARILGTGTDGALLYEIRASNAEQQADERIEFSDVEIAYTPASDVPWSVRANTATLYPDQQRLFLQGDVRASSNNGFSGKETEVQTESMALDPEQYTAETEERVYIRVGNQTLSGTGMLASLKDSQLEIKSNVSGRFSP